MDAISGIDPFIMQADGKAWLFAPGRAWSTARCPRTTSRRSRRSATRCTASSATRSGRSSGTGRTRCSPVGDRAGRGGVPLRGHHLPADRAPHRGRHVPDPALPVRAAAGVLLRGVAGAGRRAGPGAHGLGHDHHRPHRDRGPGAGHRADATLEVRRAAAAPGRAALPLGRQRAQSPATPPTTWLTCPWTRTCTSRRSRRWPATSGPAAARAGPALREPGAGVRRSGRASPTRPARRCEMSIDPARLAPGYARPSAADGLLHRHLGVHRLQGLRGGLQGVERRARGRAEPVRHVVRQHRRPGRLHLAARRVHRAAASRPLARTARRACAG